MRRKLRPRLQSVPHPDQGLGGLREAVLELPAELPQPIATPSAVPEKEDRQPSRAMRAHDDLAADVAGARGAGDEVERARHGAAGLGAHQRERLLVVRNDRARPAARQCACRAGSRASPDCRGLKRGPGCPSRRHRQRRVTGLSCRRPARASVDDQGWRAIPRQRSPERIPPAAQSRRQRQPRADMRRWRRECPLPHRPRSARRRERAAGP